MLGNKDFAKMLTGSGLNSRAGNNKRQDSSFDLKNTISQWDKDQKHKEITKSKKLGSGQTKGLSGGKATESKGGYRDRALERRKEVNVEDAKFEEIVSKLDAEQTKFLGGDIEHTHFVRGLDYALLQKMREESEKVAKEENDESESDESDTNGDITTHSTMAENIKALHLSQLPSVVAKDLTVLKRENLFPRTFYEFDLTTRTAEKSIQEGVDIEEVDTIEEVDSIPLTIMKSKKETVRMEEYVNHVLDASILNQLVVLFQSGKLCSSLIGKKKKRKLGNLEEPSLPPVPLINQAITKPINYEEKPAVVEISTAKKLASNDFGSIYDDDIVVDKYVPVGSLDETGGAEVAAPRSIAVDTSVYAANLSVRATLKGLFDHKTSAPVVKSASEASAQLLQPVNAVLKAQAAKEMAARERQAADSRPIHKEIVVETDAKGNQLVHRDVFASTKDKVVTAATNLADGAKMGDAFGLKGSYDLFPENSGDYDMFDSDGEDGEAPDAKKGRSALSLAAAGDDDENEAGAGGSSSNNRRFDASSKYVDSGYMTLKSKSGRGGGLNISEGGGTIRKSVLKNSTPWNRAGGSSSGGGANSGGAPNNRAARRAANTRPPPGGG